MASPLSRRLATKFLQFQNPNLFLLQSNSHLRTPLRSEPINPTLRTLLPLYFSTTTPLPPPNTYPVSGLPNPAELADGSKILQHRSTSAANPICQILPLPHTQFGSKLCGAERWNPSFPKSNPRTQIHLRYSPIKRFSTSQDQTQSQNQSGGSDSGEKEHRHQEIEGPTVERDLSALATETRQVLGNLRKTLYELSLSIALLGFTHLGLGAWIIYSVKPPTEVSVQGVAASSFLFTTAFLMRRTLKPLGFFNKMEERGRLQILTLTLQVTKNLNLMLKRIRVVSFFCIFGVSVGTLLCFR